MMSFVAAAESGGEGGSVSSDAGRDCSSRGGSAGGSTSGGSQKDDDLGVEEESDVEVEQLGDDGAPETPNFATASCPTSASLSPIGGNVVRHVTKRTLITMHQRTVLEEYYRNGMTSASQQLAGVHEIVAAKTGLDVNVVRNWIRNRRRPNAAKVAEKIAERMGGLNGTTTSLPTLIPSNPSSLTPLPTVPHTVVVTATNPINLTTPGLIRVTDSIPHLPAMPFSSIPHSSYPEPKRFCLDPSTQNHISSPSSTSHHPSSPLLVKVRVSGSGESDFVEVEVTTPTYSTLVSACCEELELVTSDVAKIRKLPNILVRKDRDVQRMTDSQELEVVLKGEGSASSGSVMNLISPPAAAASYPTTSMLTVNPFAPPNAAAAVLALSNQVQVQRGSPVVTVATSDGLLPLKPVVHEENGVPNHHITVVTTSDSAGEIQSHTHHPIATTVNGLQ